MCNSNLTNTTFYEIYNAAFKKKPKNLGIKKLSGGLKNRVYLMDDGKTKYIVKMGPSRNKSVAPIDENTLWWEAKVLEEIKNLNIMSPKLIYYSDGIEKFNYPFIIMNYMEGNTYSECKENLTIEQKNSISYSIGQITKKICSIKKDHFYIPAFHGKTFKNNYELVLCMFKQLLNIYNKYNINIEGITSKQILQLICSKEKELKNISNLCLCNTDLWDGNILIKNGQISGIVDFTDTFYCDELMSFYFHLPNGKNDNYFLLGYGNKKLNYAEYVRIEIYRLYVILKMIVDCEIKHYGRFGKMYTDFSNVYKKLRNI
ncbi:MAG: hypothetical protein IKV94_04800 [Clostridia bacterium]|nr:hypothetical protein [Clostridia bacterium]